MAEEFSWQLSGGTSRHTVNGFDSDHSSVDATYYLDPVDDARGPNELASFLNPTTRIAAAASRGNASTFFDNEPMAYSLSGYYVWPSSKWYAGASHSLTDDVSARGLVQWDQRKSYGATAGKYFGPNTTLELNVGTSEWRRELAACFPSSICAPATFTFESETDSVGLDVQHVGQLRSLTYVLAGGIEQTDSEFRYTDPLSPVSATSVESYTIAGELFPTPRLGVGLRFSRPDGDAVDSDAYEISTTWFFNPRVALHVSYGRDTEVATLPRTEHVALRFIGRL